MKKDRQDRLASVAANFGKAFGELLRETLWLFAGESGEEEEKEAVAVPTEKTAPTIDKENFPVQVVPMVEEKTSARILYGEYVDKKGMVSILSPSRSRKEAKAKNYVRIKDKASGVVGEMSRYKIRKLIETGEIWLEEAVAKKGPVKTKRVKKRIIGTYLYPDATVIHVTKGASHNKLNVAGVDASYSVFDSLVHDEDLVRVQDSISRDELNSVGPILKTRVFALVDGGKSFRLTQNARDHVEIVTKIGDEEASEYATMTDELAWKYLLAHAGRKIVAQAKGALLGRVKNLHITGKTFVELTTLEVTVFTNAESTERASIVCNGETMYRDSVYKKYDGLGLTRRQTTESLEDIDSDYPEDLYTFHFPDKACVVVLESVGGKSVIKYRYNSDIVVTVQVDLIADAIDHIKTLMNPA